MRYLSLGLISFVLLACQKDSFTLLQQNDSLLQQAQPGEWRYEHKENGQSFDEFIASKPLQPGSSKQPIVLIPLGHFTPKQEEQLQACSEYIQLFFQLPCKIDSIPETMFPSYAQRTGSDGQLQVLAPYLLDSVLVAHKTNASLAMMALSAYDLYPEQQWNYVFGLASYSKRVSVSSLYRFQTELQPERNFDMSFLRLIKTASHEIGHMFGLHHCLHAQCVMNGSNSLSELDRTPARLCSSCLQKLQHSVGFNIKKRTTELIQFARSKQLKAAQIDLENDWILLSQ